MPKDPFAIDFVNSMRQLDVRQPKDMFAAVGNLTFALGHVFDRLASVEEQLAEENDELESLRESAVALAEHVVAGRTAEALELAKVVLSWYEDEKEETETDATRTTPGIEEQTIDAGSEKPGNGHDIG